MRKSPRDRRLSSDFQSVQKLQSESSIFSFEATGNPPQRYRFTFSGAGFMRRKDDYIAVVKNHEVIVELGAAYPRMVPNLAWQTPIFHPNISNNGVVCLGGYGTHWVPSLTLCEMCTMLWDMIRYENFDTESPYNREAALWAKTQSEHVLPVDRRSIRNRISGHTTPLNKTAAGLEFNQVKELHIVENEVVVQPVNGGDSGIEIIESGIEIVERRDHHLANDDGITFLD